jgi:hypothetical protein
MLANPHKRNGSRRLAPMPEATREAARNYALERLALIDRTRAMVRSSSVRQERLAWQRLLAKLADEQPTRRPA